MQTRIYVQITQVDEGWGCSVLRTIPFEDPAAAKAYADSYNKAHATPQYPGQYVPTSWTQACVV